jgi:hypothetical protein
MSSINGTATANSIRIQNAGSPGAQGRQANSDPSNGGGGPYSLDIPSTALKAGFKFLPKALPLLKSGDTKGLVTLGGMIGTGMVKPFTDTLKDLWDHPPSAQGMWKGSRFSDLSNLVTGWFNSLTGNGHENDKRGTSDGADIIVHHDGDARPVWDISGIHSPAKANPIVRGASFGHKDFIGTDSGPDDTKDVSPSSPPAPVGGAPASASNPTVEFTTRDRRHHSFQDMFFHVVQPGTPALKLSGDNVLQALKGFPSLDALTGNLLLDKEGKTPFLVNGQNIGQIYPEAIYNVLVDGKLGRRDFSGAVQALLTPGLLHKIQFQAPGQTQHFTLAQALVAAANAGNNPDATAINFFFSLGKMAKQQDPIDSPKTNDPWVDVILGNKLGTLKTFINDHPVDQTVPIGAGGLIGLDTFLKVSQMPLSAAEDFFLFYARMMEPPSEIDWQKAGIKANETPSYMSSINYRFHPYM